ncbi:hypothetical protein CEXT_263121 [Caerostris extrusa]|uniref:Uncharacterized protein n=1 Tax=Caerostris extrusa TaxID=172846 RepID=A0AAV4XSP4_CAEEX|nr:hypothetical protein CEXT_263121 [Caerostris extrusa]
MAIVEGNSFDIQNTNVELSTAASDETIMNIGNNNVTLDEAIDDKNNLNIDDNEVMLDAPVSEETVLDFDNPNVVQEAAPEIIPNLSTKGKEILLDVVELMGKIDEKNVFLNNTHVTITRSKRLKARQPEEETISSKAESSFNEMDFKYSSWMITKNCDSVSKRDNPKKRQSPAKQDLHSKKWTLHPPTG